LPLSNNQLTYHCHQVSVVKKTIAFRTPLKRLSQVTVVRNWRSRQPVQARRHVQPSDTGRQRKSAWTTIARRAYRLVPLKRKDFQ
jgi:hypothetical protein